MQHTEILRLFNHALAGDMLTWKQLVPHLNWCIDEINVKMNTKFPSRTLQSTQRSRISIYAQFLSQEPCTDSIQ